MRKHALTRPDKPEMVATRSACFLIPYRLSALETKVSDEITARSLDHETLITLNTRSEMNAGKLNHLGDAVARLEGSVAQALLSAQTARALAEQSH